MANGIDFVIGGKDKAAPAMGSVEKSLQRIEQRTETVAKSTQRLAAVTSTLTAAYVAVKSVVALLGGVDKLNAAFDAQTESVRQLNATLQIRGASAASAQMQGMAKDLEKLTGVSDNVTLGLMQQAQAMGFATDRMDDAAKAAIGLANATGKDAGAAMSDLKAALEGNFDAFLQLNPQIMYMRSNQEKMAAVMAIANQGMNAMSADMTTVAGSGRRADSAMSSLMETIGSIMAPIRVLINAGLQQLSESFQTILAPAAEYAQQVLANIGPWMDWLKEKIVAGINIIVGAFTFFETILTNLGSVWDMAVAYAEMSMIALKENVMHVLTVAIPEYAKWFGQNLVNLIKDAFNGVITIVMNAGRILGDMVYQIFEFIASGGEGGISGLMRGLGESASRGLLDGFESSLTALPDIAERQLTQREKDLADKIGSIGGRLGAEFSDKFSERMVGVGSGLGEELNAATKNLDLKARASVITQGIGATEGRLLTRGPASIMQSMLDAMTRTQQNTEETKKHTRDIRTATWKEAEFAPENASLLEQIMGNTANTTQMVPVQ